MRTRFQMGLDELKQKLLAMGGLAEQAIDRATEAYRKRDLQLCYAVLEGEKAINMAEREIDELAVDLLAMQQPLAVDLRFITACMKINADLERVGDHAVNIVERVMSTAKLPQVDLPVDIPRMASTAASMVRRGLEAFIEGRADLAEAILTMDDILDKMNRESYIVLVQKMREEPAIVQQALDTLLISRNLERVADHATNIAEDVIFWVRGADVRHHVGIQESPTPPLT